MKPEKKMKEHIDSCAAQAGFSFSFDNGKIINYRTILKNLATFLLLFIMTLR